MCYVFSRTIKTNKHKEHVLSVFLVILIFEKKKQYIKLFLRTFSENTKNTKKMFSENSSLCFKFSVFYVLQEKNKPETKQLSKTVNKQAFSFCF